MRLNAKQRATTDEEIEIIMKHEPSHQALANDEAPTTRLTPISEEVDAVERSGDTIDPPPPSVEASPIISVDVDSRFCVGFTESA